MKFINIRDFYFLFVIVLIRFVSWFSSPTLKALAVNSIASAAYRFSTKKRRFGEKNLFEAFAEKLAENQQQEIIKDSFHDFWAETFSFMLCSKERVTLKSIEVHGIEHLHSALKNGRGVILWESGFFGRRNLAKQILHEHGFRMHQVHAMGHLGGFSHPEGAVTWIRHHIIRSFFDKCEEQFVADIIDLPNSDSLAFTRHLLKQLKQNSIICITGDGLSGQKLISLKFLGCTRLFSTGMVSLAKISGASILPMFCVQERNTEINLTIEPPIQIQKSVDRECGLENCLAQYVNLLESYIRKYPEMYRDWQGFALKTSDEQLQQHCKRHEREFGA